MDEQRTLPEANVPDPPSERRAWLLAGGTCLTGLAVLVAALLGWVARAPVTPVAPPAIETAASTPVPTPSASFPAVASGEGVRSGASASSPAIVGSPSPAQQHAEATRLRGGGGSGSGGGTNMHIARRWMEGFYPIYATSQRTFGVSWLLIASIHMQESAFSTAPDTYHGLNFAHCCGGPMQFNVINGPVTTWRLVSDSYVYGRRPARYDHMTSRHPSIYDDFDAIMAAAHLLSADGAGYALDASAWNAAYDYYGHDATGVAYADEVLARAIGWSQHGFCVNCGVEGALVSAVHAAYGAPVLAALTSAEQARPAPRAKASGVRG